MKLSVIIPSYKDPLLQKTIDSILEGSELGDQLEIIAVLDGYWPDPPLKGDPRVKILHLGKNQGMRNAINAGVAISKGEFIMRTDEHCMFDKGFDRKMTDACEDNWIMTAARYFLDPVKWEIIKDIKPFYFEKLAINEASGKFEGQRWFSRDKELKNEMIAETMAMQGSAWVMSRKWWDKVIKELQTEGYGRHYQDSHEMVFKTWQAGGKLMLNKNTWFAHKHYKFPRTHNEAHFAKDSWDYCLSVWRDYYLKEVKPKWNL